MCGLVGFATTDPEAKLKALFTELLVLSSFRGIHSTGVAAIDTADNETEVLKVVGNPFNLFETQSYNGLSSNFKNVWIGHTRHATRGTVSKWNAHPFEFGDIVGAHNGTINNDYDLRKEVEAKFGLESDSQVLFAHLSEHGVRDTVSKTKGAYALTFYDKEAQMLYFIKNEDRPLWYCFNEDKTVMWWASEWTMLEYILSARNKIEFWRDEEGFGFFPVEDDVLYGFSVPREKSYKVGKKPLIELVVYEELKGAEKYKPLVSTPFLTAEEENWEGYSVPGPGRTKLLQSLAPPVTPKSEKQDSTNTSSCSTECQTENSSTASRNPKPTLRLVTTNKSDSLDDSLLYGPDGQLLFSPEFRKLVSDGCLWCNADIAEEDANQLRWVISTPAKDAESTIHVLCPSCSDPNSEAMDSKKWIQGAYGHVTEPIVEIGRKATKSKRTTKPKKETTTVDASKPKTAANSK